MEKSVESGESLFKVLSFVSVYFLIVYSRRHSNLIFSLYICVTGTFLYICDHDIRYMYVLYITYRLYSS